MSNLANGNNEVLNCDRKDEAKNLTSTDSVKTSCKPTQSMTTDDDRKPLTVKKIGEMNGMTLSNNEDKNTTDHGDPASSSISSQNSEGILPDEASITDERGVENSSNDEHIEYVGYESELQMGAIMALITKDLSEPYSIYTYRYFIHNWPNLCFLAMHKDQCVGAIVCKLDVHKNMVHRGYIAMLAVEKEFRRHKIGTKLVKKAMKAMIEDNCDEVVLETEITNKAALRLYEKLGFVRDKRLFRYYLNGVDALRLKLWLR